MGAEYRDTARPASLYATSDQVGIVPTMVSHLRACAVDLVKTRQQRTVSNPVLKGNGGTRHKIDKSVLTISEPKRIRCKEHLRFVASQPCLICGRSPSHAHHMRYAQSRGLSLKVSDEFTVPLCAIHHHQIHTTGKERSGGRSAISIRSRLPMGFGSKAVSEIPHHQGLI